MTTSSPVVHDCDVQARLETTMRSFPSSAEVAREAELEKQELAMKRKRSAHEVGNTPVLIVSRFCICVVSQDICIREI